MKPADIRTTLNYVGGEFVTASSGKTYENRSLVNGSLINIVSEADQIEVDAAVAAALADTGKPVCIHLSSIPKLTTSV